MTNPNPWADGCRGRPSFFHHQWENMMNNTQERQGLQHVSGPIQRLLEIYGITGESEEDVKKAQQMLENLEPETAPVLELSSGARIANFSSGHPFLFDDGRTLCACDHERVERLKMEPQERELLSEGRWTDIVIDFELTQVVLDELIEAFVFVEMALAIVGGLCSITLFLIFPYAPRGRWQTMQVMPSRAAGWR